MLSPACNCVLCCRFVFILTSYHEKCLHREQVAVVFSFALQCTLCCSFFSSLLNNLSQRPKLTLSVTLISATLFSATQLSDSHRSNTNSATFTSATSNSHCKFSFLFSRSPSLIKQSMQCKKLGGGIKEENS